MIVTGKLKKDRRTKNLVQRLKKGNIALINHKDIDPVAAQALINSQVCAVINTAPSFSGSFPTTGALLLTLNNIPIIDVSDETVFDKLVEDEVTQIDFDTGTVTQNGIVVLGTVLTEKKLQKDLQESEHKFSDALKEFVENTLAYLCQDGKATIFSPLFIPPLKTKIYKRHALVVVRGHRYREDLLAILSYIKNKKPVLIGVDGGADALLEIGLKPDIIIGDMDSVSESALRSGAELIVHAYSDGRAPGLSKIYQLGLKAYTFPVEGTSEDAALLLAYEAGASLIVAVGTHSSSLEFLEKSRKGMASTFLVRLKVGHKLVDTKGVSELYSVSLKWKHILALLTSGALVSGGLIHFSPTLQIYLRPLWLWLRTMLEQLFLNLR